MIYTVTISPAIDYVVHVDEMIPGSTNRSSSEEYYFGGKGINVSLILKELGLKSRALGFVSGFTGEALEKGLQDKGIETDFVKLGKGITRINIKIKSAVETELNTQGAMPEEGDLEKLIDKLKCLQNGDVLVLSGSVPKGLPENTYERIIDAVNAKGIKVVLDTSGAQLLNALKTGPFLIKPNMDELRELFGDIEAEDGARRLQKAGAKNVIVSMGGNGALLVSEDGRIFRCGVVSGNAKNTVGAGDSMVAGFIAGLLEKNDYDYAMMLGSAAGAATAMSPGLGSGGTIREFLEKLREADEK